MAQQRTAAPPAEFVKMQTIGQQVIGLVTRYGSNNNGPMIILSPVILRSGNKGRGDRFEELALGLSTDLAQKITAADTGKVLGIAFTATKPSTKESPTKLFQVFELDGDDLEHVKAGTLVLPLAEEKAPSPAGNGNGNGTKRDKPF